MKKIVLPGAVFFLTTVLVGISIVGTASASSPDTENELNARPLDELYITINQEKVTLDEQPLLIDENNRTLAPVRFVSAHLGAEVAWHEEGERGLIAVNHEDEELIFHVGRNKFFKNGRTVEMDTMTRVTENDRAVVPLRPLAEGLDMEVKWDDGTIELTNPALADEAQVMEASETPDELEQAAEESKEEENELSEAHVSETDDEKEDSEQSDIDKIVEESSAIYFPGEREEEADETEAKSEPDAKEDDQDEAEDEEKDEKEDEGEKLFEAIRNIVNMHNPNLSDAAIHRIITQSERLDIEPAVILGLIRVESVFDPTNVSSAGAAGLMQLMPGTASSTAYAHGFDYSWDALLDPDYNVTIGTLHFRDLLNRYDDNLHMALTAYNMGTAGAESHVRNTGTSVSWFSDLVMGKVNKYRDRLP